MENTLSNSLKLTNQNSDTVVNNVPCANILNEDEQVAVMAIQKLFSYSLTNPKNYYNEVLSERFISQKNIPIKPAHNYCFNVFDRIINNDIVRDAESPVSVIRPLAHISKPNKIEMSIPIRNTNKSENESISVEDIRLFENLEKQKESCCICKRLEKKTNCFAYNDSYICLACAVKHCRDYKQIEEWNNLGEKTLNMKKCDRLCHQRPLYHFLKVEKKNGQYKVGKLCVYCRNVKRWEYLQSHRCNKRKN